MGFWGQEYDSKDVLVNSRTSNSLSECIFDYLGYKAFAGSLKVSSIRNPLARAISIFAHNSWNAVKTFDEFCYCLENNIYPNPCARWHAQPMYRHLCIRGSLCIDNLVRVENMDKALARLEQRLRKAGNITSPINIVNQASPTPHENKSNHKSRVVLTDKNKDLLYLYYREDFEGFGYYL